MLNRKLFCVAFAALALSACGGGNSPTGPTGTSPVPDPIATTITVLSTEGGAVPSARITLADSRVLMTDGAGIANPGNPLPRVGDFFRIEAEGYLGYGMGGRIVRFGLDDEPPGSGRYTLQPLRDQYSARFVCETNYGNTMCAAYLMKAPGPLTFRNRNNDPRIDLALFNQGWQDWQAAGCDTNGGAPAVVEVWIDPNDRDIVALGAVAVTRISGNASGVWAQTVFRSEAGVRSMDTIWHELGRSIGFSTPNDTVSVGWSVMSNTRGHYAPYITEFDKMNCVYRAHRRERNKWVDDATNAR